MRDDRQTDRYFKGKLVWELSHEIVEAIKLHLTLNAYETHLIY